MKTERTKFNDWFSFGHHIGCLCALYFVSWYVINQLSIILLINKLGLKIGILTQPGHKFLNRMQSKLHRNIAKSEKVVIQELKRNLYNLPFSFNIWSIIT